MDLLKQSHPLGIFRKVLQAYWCSWYQQSSGVPFHGHFSLSAVKHDCYHCARFSFSHRTNIQPFKFHHTLRLTVRSMFRLLQEHTWKWCVYLCYLCRQLLSLFMNVLKTKCQKTVKNTHYSFEEPGLGVLWWLVWSDQQSKTQRWWSYKDIKTENHISEPKGRVVKQSLQHHSPEWNSSINIEWIGMKSGHRGWIIMPLVISWPFCYCFQHILISKSNMCLSWTDTLPFYNFQQSTQQQKLTRIN